MKDPDYYKRNYEQAESDCTSYAQSSRRSGRMELLAQRWERERDKLEAMGVENAVGILSKTASRAATGPQAMTTPTADQAEAFLRGDGKNLEAVNFVADSLAEAKSLAVQLRKRKWKSQRRGDPAAP